MSHTTNTFTLFFFIFIINNISKYTIIGVTHLLTIIIVVFSIVAVVVYLLCCSPEETTINEQERTPFPEQQYDQKLNYFGLRSQEHTLVL